jgi:hypothetical protein
MLTRIGLATIQKCIADVFEKRFALTSTFKDTSVAEILGHSGDEPIAKEISRLYNQKKLHTLRYHGWETVIRLCSGDISYVIDILSNILREKPKKYPVSRAVQSKAIKLYARSELYRNQDLSEGACNLYEVALNFGKFSLFKLLNSKVGEEKRPSEYLRLEIEVEKLSAVARSALGELLRNGVFIDGGFSNSSRGSPARRLIFKKLFTPAFPTTYNNRDTWSMSARHFEEFISNPKAFVKKVMGEHGVPPDEQGPQLDMLIQKT